MPTVLPTRRLLTGSTAVRMSLRCHRGPASLNVTTWAPVRSDFLTPCLLKKGWLVPFIVCNNPAGSGVLWLAGSRTVCDLGCRRSMAWPQRLRSLTQ